MSADIHALAGAYALNALPPDEQAFFERHLAACDACRQEVAELQETAARLAAGVAAAPPAALRDKVLAAADVTRQLPPESPAPQQRTATRWQGWQQRALVPVAAGLLIVVVALSSVIVNLDRRQQPAEESGDAPIVALLGAEDLQAVELDLGGAAPGRFLYSSKLDRGVLVTHGVPDPGARETYELWLMHDGRPVPAGLFGPGDGGPAVTEVTAPIRGAEIVAVTVEPAGGSETPTGEVLASASLTS